MATPHVVGEAWTALVHALRAMTRLALLGSQGPVYFTADWVML